MPSVQCCAGGIRLSCTFVGKQCGEHKEVKVKEYLTYALGDNSVWKPKKGLWDVQESTAREMRFGRSCFENHFEQKISETSPMNLIEGLTTCVLTE